MLNQKGLTTPIILLILVVVVLGAFGGFYYLKNSNQNQTDQDLQPRVIEEKIGHPKLDSWLYDLATAKTDSERKSFENEYVIGDQVRVEVEVFDASYTLSPEFGTEEVRAENRIQAKIYINKLLQLADDKRIRSIQQLMKALPAN